MKLYSRENRLNNNASSLGFNPGPVSLTLINCRTGVTSGVGSFDGNPIEPGKAYVLSEGGTNETSDVVMILLTSLDAMNRIATKNDEHYSQKTKDDGGWNIRYKAGDDLSQLHWISLDSINLRHLQSLFKLQHQINPFHLGFTRKDRRDFTCFFPQIHLNVVQAQHV